MDDELQVDFNYCQLEPDEAENAFGIHKERLAETENQERKRSVRQYMNVSPSQQELIKKGMTKVRLPVYDMRDN